MTVVFNSNPVQASDHLAHQSHEPSQGPDYRPLRVIRTRRVTIPPPMHSKTPPRNRLAKVLPEPFRKQLHDAGIPKRKYTAILRATLTTGQTIDEMIVEQGWIIALTREGLAGTNDTPIAIDPRTIESVEILQYI